MRLNKLQEAMLWLPGFGPDEDPIEFLGAAGENVADALSAPLQDAVILQFPSGNAKTAKAFIAKAVKPVWPRLERAVLDSLGGIVSKYDANINAIKLLRQLELEDREPSQEERNQLNQYTGWGGIPAAFNAHQADPKWVERASTLKALLAEEEFESAETSTPNAHYTSPEVVEAVWAAVQRMGFQGGNILEPASGIGYFLGSMPKEIAEQSNVTAVELDVLSARITRKLYQSYGVNVINKGLEGSDLPDGFYDLVISNVPFGNYKVSEVRNVPFANFSIHNYFIAKSLELVRDGGLVAVITSSYTMDAKDDHVRQYLASQANLVGAIRLPNSAFKAIANTDVTTDILFFQKESKASNGGAGWSQTTSISRTHPLYGESVPPWGTPVSLTTNSHFAEHPEFVVGNLKNISSAYGYSVGCVFAENDVTFEESLKSKVTLLPADIYQAKAPVEEVRQPNVIALDQRRRLGYFLQHGKVFEVMSTGTSAKEAELRGRSLERVKGMIMIRDAARKLIAAQSDTADDNLLARYRLALTVSYDDFVRNHGNLHLKVNRVAFRDDPDLPLLLALERWSEDTDGYTKADLFYRRTVGTFRRLEQAQSPQEALLASLAEYGHVVPKRIAELLGSNVDDAMRDLENAGAVYLDPKTCRYETADAYLSGDVKKKLKMAKASGAKFQRNVDALTAILPEDLLPSEIGIRIGSTWVPAGIYDSFFDEISETKGNRVLFNQVVGTWAVAGVLSTGYSVACSQTYGTERVNAVKLFEQALNQQVPTVTDTFRDGTVVVNAKETIAAREKQQSLKDKFVEWAWSDHVRAEKLSRLYNSLFNNTVRRKYDGSHLVLPGFSQVYQLYPHQKDSIWRVVSSAFNTLLAHVVGAGKTLTMICSGMELRRTGKAQKPMHVVPNHMLEQYAAEFLRAYPGANILMASKDDLVGDRRRELISRIATGDWDAVLITHASFERISMSPDFMKDYIRVEIEQIKSAIRAQKDKSSNKVVKELARAKKSWEARLTKLESNDKKDDLLCFEDLGVDWLFIDEAHYFKNLWRFSKMTRVAGLPTSNSQRAFDMFVKCSYIMDQHQGRTGITFATGTPISNSMAEFWVMQRYLQPKTLSAYQCEMFDAWAGNFGESVTALELSPDGAGYRMQTRFAKFINLPELMTIFGEVADIRTAEMLNLPVPNVVRETITAKSSAALKAHVQGLVDRAEAIRNGRVTPHEDNMLAVTGDGRKAALDMRLVNLLAPDEPVSKVNLCCRKVYEIWHRTQAQKSTQIIFCDQGTPNGDGRFSVYADVRSKLMDRGIPESQIAFIHDFDSDAAKAALFQQVREGKVRVLLGSTNKLGVGTNVQTKLIALHHLDAPWRPSDVEQRDGRMVRQGNQNETVYLFRYVTEGSFDAYIWQTLETKARFIAQIMSGGSGLRTAEDVELAALSYAEVKALASGNPLVLEKAGVDSELAKLTILKSQWDNQQWANKREMANLPHSIEIAKARLTSMEDDLAWAETQTDNSFMISIKGHEYDDVTDAGKALVKAASKTPEDSKDFKVAEFKGFAVVTHHPAYADSRVSFSLKRSGQYEVSKAETYSGAIRALERAVQDISVMVERQVSHISHMEKRLSDLQVVVAKTFDRTDRLEWLQNRQREIETMLDLTKGDMAAADATESAEAA